MGGGGGEVTSRRKVHPGNISRRGRTKGDTMPRAGSILLAREKRIAERTGPVTLRARRCRGETGQAHCCRNDAHRRAWGNNEPPDSREA